LENNPLAYVRVFVKGRVRTDKIRVAQLPGFSLPLVPAVGIAFVIARRVDSFWQAFGIGFAPVC
jgi:hypothetical protein